MDTLTYTGQLTKANCWCGIYYAVPTELYNHVRRQQQEGRPQTNIWCPLGHAWTFAGEGEAAKLRRQLEAERSRVDYWRREQERTELRRRAAVGVATKAKKRAARGVCPTPECHRSFVDVARHVRTKHPQLLEEAPS